jgi:N-acetyl-gamma-glutamyl-phosphate reductase
MGVVFIDGDSGTVGQSIAKRLDARADIKLLRLPDRHRRDLTARVEAIREADVSVLCLPDDASREIVAALGPDGRVIDASTAYRTHDSWTYGFPELTTTRRAEISASTRVTNPGCHAIASVALLAPLVSVGMLSSDIPVTIFSVTGYTGGGKSLIAEFEGAKLDAAVYLYALDQRHKHLPEIQQHAGLVRRPTFVPAVGKFRQGMAVTIPLPLASLGVSAMPGDLRSALAAHYAGRDGPSGLRVATQSESDAVKGRLDPRMLAGRDDMVIHVFEDQAGDQAVLCALLDNLGKGAGGQALQSVDIILSTL